MQPIYQPYPLDTAHMVPVSRIGNRPTTPTTATTRTVAMGTTPRIINGSIVPIRADLLTELDSAQPATRDWAATARLWAHRIWITIKVLAALTAVAAAAALVYLLVLAVIALVAAVMTAIAWVTAHLAQIIAVIVVLIIAAMCGSGGGGIHCPGCRR
jgi:lysylphosphatidylglycerol synthetase-like protein (DUF2156 family)